MFIDSKNAMEAIQMIKEKKTREEINSGILFQLQLTD
jgi:hypothetical protein